MGYLNGILARVGGNLNNNFQKSQMPGGLPGGGGEGGMLKLRFDRYITGGNEAGVDLVLIQPFLLYYVIHVVLMLTAIFQA